MLVFSLLLGLKSQSLVWCLFSATVLIWYISKYHQGNPQNRSCISLLLITSTADTLALPTSFLTVEYCPGFPTDLPLLCFTSKVFYSHAGLRVKQVLSFFYHMLRKKKIHQGQCDVIPAFSPGFFFFFLLS